MKYSGPLNMLKRKLLNTWLPGIAAIILATVLTS